MTGIDWAWGQPSDTALTAAHVIFVCRYLSTADTTKCITRAEADRHKAAGRGIVLVFENQADRMLAGHSAGQADATAAQAQADAAGLPGTPIYFAADWDATPAQQTQINAYLDGAASVIGRHRTGIYGGYWPLSRARAAGKAAYFWGTLAWSGNNWDPARNPDAFTPHIMQGAATSIGGVECDLDVAHFADYGQYKEVPVTPAKPPAPPGQWENPAFWTWQDAYMTGTGLDGKIHIFHYESGHWMKLR